MGRSSKSTINDIIKLIECDHILAFISPGAAAGCHGNGVFHITPQLWFGGIKRRDDEPPNVLALKRTDTLFSPEIQPSGLLHPVLLGQGCSSALPFTSWQAAARRSPCCGWVKPRVSEKGGRERGEDSPSEPPNLKRSVRAA